MFKNYFKTSLRNIFRNKTAPFIQIAGLAIGLAASLLILFYVHFERSYEEMHAQAENIFRITLELYNGNELIEVDAATYQTLGPGFKASMPEVLDFARFYPVGASELKAVSSETSNYENKIYYADPSAFDVFSYGFLDRGNITKFNEPFTVVITEKLALKYFGKMDIIGELLQFDFHDNPMEIVAVLEDLPQNTHLKFDLLISHSTLPIVETWYAHNLWNANNEYTYLLMKEGTDLDVFNQKLADFSQSNPHINNENVIAEKIGDIHLYSNKSYEPEVNGRAQTVSFMFYTGLLILFLAWINYINLSTAKAMERAKEVGIRKTIGSTKGQLVFQFFCEAFLTNMLSGVLAAMVLVMVLPVFGSLTGQDLSLEQFGNLRFGSIMFGFIAVGTLVSGFYPAFVLSTFKPISVLKGKFSNTSKGIVLRKGLVFVQFTATVILICMSLAIFRQMQYLTAMDLGVAIDNTLVIRKPESSMQDSVKMALGNAFETQLLKENWVKGVTQSSVVPGADIKELSSNSSIKRLGADKNQGSYNYYHYRVKENYPDLMELEMIAGRAFDFRSPGEMILINEKAMKNLGFASAEEAIGQKLDWQITDKPTEILGVFRNFHQRSPKEQYLPLILWQSEFTDNFIVKLNTQDTRQALAGIHTVWNEIYPKYTFEYYFLNDQYNHQYHNDRQFGKSVLLFTFLAIIIAGLGLFGLSSFMVLLRTKEIGIRKVLGASIGSLVGLLTKDFLSIVLAAGIAAIPIAYMLVQVWLENYAEKFDQDWLLFVMPLLLILAITLLTIGGQTLKSANANPVDSMRSE